MAKKINTSIEIKASKEIVWRVLMDFEAYPEWNKFMTFISGEAKVGSQLSIKVQEMSFKPKVLSVKTNEEFKWIGRIGIKGIFDGEHCFQLMENETGVVSFLHSESFSGILVPIFSKSLDRKTKSGFEQMNLALKERAEAIAKQ